MCIPERLYTHSPALEIPTKDVRLIKNTLFPDLAELEPCKVVCFPFPQHYMADSPGCRTYIENRNEMIGYYNKMADRKEMNTKNRSKIFTT